MAKEAFDLVLKNNGIGLLCKLGIERVYVHMNWTILLFILNSMNFGCKQTDRIH